MCTLTYVLCHVKNGFTCLHAAIYYGHLEIVKFLVQKSGKELVSIMDKNSQTALDIAKSGGNPDVITFLEKQ